MALSGFEGLMGTVFGVHLDVVDALNLEGVPIDEYNRLALDRVKSLSGHWELLTI